MANRERVVPGQTIIWKGETWIVLDIPAIDRLVVRNTETLAVDSAPASEIKPHRTSEIRRSDKPLLSIQDEDWHEAWRRFTIIQPLVEKGPFRRTKQDVDATAKAAKKGPATIYRWLAAYEESEVVSSLLRKDRGDKGKSRLNPKLEKVLDKAIEDSFMTDQKESLADTIEEVVRVCREAGLKPPHPNTVRLRINRIAEKERVAKREGGKRARERFDPKTGRFPGADYPLAVIQIDHTPVDLIIVDDEHREPIGRPYLTIAIDVCTRMIAGFYVTLEPPSALSAGLCIINAVLPKEQLLANFEITVPWPIWGKMQKIHVDNAKEFDSKMLRRACKEHGIKHEFRPKGFPNFGGHVERAFGTFMKKVHTLPGTTFSNIREKGDYDSSGKAIMTLDEFEHWFTVFVVEVYHQKKHKGITDIPPIRAYEMGIFGDDKQPGVGLPMPLENEEKFRFDFMPYQERTVQQYGVVIDYIFYYSDVLRHWIHARDPENSKLKRKFIFARDPRDISVVYFLDPDTNTYYPIPYADPTRPVISLWELKKVLKRLEDDDIRTPNEEIIFEGIRKMREIEDTAAKKTKAARRQKQRRKKWGESRKDTAAKVPSETTYTESNEYDDYPHGEILPFDDIEEAQ